MSEESASSHCGFATARTALGFQYRSDYWESLKLGEAVARICPNTTALRIDNSCFARPIMLYGHPIGVVWHVGEGDVQCENVLGDQRNTPLAVAIRRKFLFPLFWAPSRHSGRLNPIYPTWLPRRRRQQEFAYENVFGFACAGGCDGYTRWP